MEGRAARITELKRALQKTVPAVERASGEPIPTGTEIDGKLLGGGFPRGRVAEVAGARSSGKAALALQAAAQATRAARLVAWIDAPRELYPPAAAALGVELGRLLVVRPHANSPRTFEMVKRRRQWLAK